jgi:hypothetical protein
VDGLGTWIGSLFCVGIRISWSLLISMFIILESRWLTQNASEYRLCYAYPLHGL